MPYGYPFREVELKSNQQEMTIKSALEYAVDIIKERQRRHKSKLVTESYGRMIIEWCEKNKYTNGSIRNFTSGHAHMFFDDLVKFKKPSPRTYNNYLTYMRMFFKALVDRDILEKNPFEKVDKQRVTAQTRHRKLSKEERQLIAGQLWETDYWLFLSIVIQYNCFIRPAELRRLKVGDFNFKEGIIHVRGEVSKNWAERFATIPSDSMSYFLPNKWKNLPSHYYVFGGGIERRPSERQIGRDSLSKRHKKLIDRLAKEGKINPEGVSYYCWKHSGISRQLKLGIPLPQVSGQAGHGSVHQTMQYNKNDKISVQIQQLKDDLLPGN